MTPAYKVTDRGVTQPHQVFLSFLISFQKYYANNFPFIYVFNELVIFLTILNLVYSTITYLTDDMVGVGDSTLPACPQYLLCCAGDLLFSYLWRTLFCYSTTAAANSTGNVDKGAIE